MPIYACPSCSARFAVWNSQCLACGMPGLSAVCAEVSAAAEARTLTERLAIEPLEGDVPEEESFTALDGAIGRVLSERLPEAGELVAVTGPAGSGKSTAVGEACRSLSHTIGGRVLWLDAREMVRAELRRTLERAGWSFEERRLVDRAEIASLASVRLALLQHDARIVVLDSLHNAAESERDQLAILALLRDHLERGARRFFFVVAHANASGDLFGSSRFKNAPGAIVRITREELTNTKCRWAPPITIPKDPAPTSPALAPREAAPRRPRPRPMAH